MGAAAKKPSASSMQALLTKSVHGERPQPEVKPKPGSTPLPPRAVGQEPEVVPRPPKKRRGRNALREDKTHVGAHLDSPFHRQLYRLAGEQGVPIKALVIEAMNLLFVKYGYPALEERDEGEE